MCSFNGFITSEKLDNGKSVTLAVSEISSISDMGGRRTRVEMKNRTVFELDTSVSKFLETLDKLDLR